MSDILYMLTSCATISLVLILAPVEGLGPDRTALLVDFGQSSLSLSVLSFRHGLIYTITSVHDPKINGEQIDVKLTDASSGLPGDGYRGQAKLCLALEHAKRTVSASLGTASCAVESLKDGVDFTGSINRLRFDTEVRTVYDADLRASIDLLESAGLEPLHVDEMIYVGGGASLPGLDETFFAEGMQAHLLAEISMEDAHLHDLFKRVTEHAAVHATAKTIGNILPEAESDVRTLKEDWAASESAEKKVRFELWELNEGVKVEKVKPPKFEDDGAEEEKEEEELREKTITKETHLGLVSLLAEHAQKEKSRWKTRVEVQFVVENAGGVILTAWELSKECKGESTTIAPVLHS
ncbi:hypothetical protein DFH11DRAFT_1727063 [Phellopilus nigrolimitatus]|nr:hypothetical protein DFH11DRAFT_1727063 [Phellopilus nigrolimitatus]